MLTVGDKLPNFKVKATVSLEKGKEFQDITNETFKGKWTVLFAWPKDFTFICPTEIAEFGKKNKDFADRDAQVLGLSTDSDSCTTRGARTTRTSRACPSPCWRT
jgi:peroxiredoxin (alkyl hydroperoxide reductase subunit C)